MANCILALTLWHPQRAQHHQSSGCSEEQISDRATVADGTPLWPPPRATGIITILSPNQGHSSPQHPPSSPTPCPLQHTGNLTIMSTNSSGANDPYADPLPAPRVPPSPPRPGAPHTIGERPSAIPNHIAAAGASIGVASSSNLFVGGFDGPAMVRKGKHPSQVELVKDLATYL